MSATLADSMQGFYSSALGRAGTLQDLEREYFLVNSGASAATSLSWMDAARAYFSVLNGSASPTSIQDEAFKYYSSLSGLTPAASYSLADHMYKVFASPADGGNGGPSPSAPITDQLEAYYDAEAFDGYVADGRVSKNLLTPNQASIEIDTTGLFAFTNCSIARVTTQSYDGLASLSLTSAASGNMTAGQAQTVGNRTAVVGGRTYTAVVYSRSAVSARQARVSIDWLDSSGTFISAVGGTLVTNTTTGWTQLTVTGTSPANAAFCGVYMTIVSTGAASEVHYADNFGLTLGENTNWLPPVVNSGNKPSVQFDGVSDIMTTTQYFTGAPVTIYTVYLPREQAGGVSRAVWGNSLAGDVGIRQMAGINGGDDGVTFSGLFGYTFGVGIVDVAKVTSIQVNSGATQPDLRINGTAQALDASGTNTATAGNGYGLGGSLTHGSYHCGQIAAHLVYSGIHTTQQRQQIERWLGGRFGVTVA